MKNIQTTYNSAPNLSYFLNDEQMYFMHQWFYGLHPDFIILNRIHNFPYYKLKNKIITKLLDIK